MKAVREEKVELRGKDLWNRQVFLSRGFKKEGVIDEQSGETEEEEVMGEGTGESKMEELVSEWGWRRDRGS